MPDNNTPSQGWTPGNWTPGGWTPGTDNPYFNPQPLPPMTQPQPGNSGPAPVRGPGSGGGGYIDIRGGRVRPNTAGIVGTPGGTPEGANRGEAIPPQFGPNLGSNNVTMPGMFSPTGLGNPNAMPMSLPRQILNDKLYKTLGG